jgi:hypothetical protein
MDSQRFDHLTRTVSVFVTRRAALGALGLAVVPIADRAAAKGRKKPKIKRNQFGCVNVGNACTKASECCSGICEGSKGKKHCQAHNTDVCRVGQDSCDVAVSCAIPSGPDAGFCFTTTGNAPYCGAGGGKCFACSKDSECVPFCGKHAACVRCPSCQSETGSFTTACIGLDQECFVPEP